uniref:F-box and WD repeat domain containing 9 n=1 Tax=Oryzias latipes TaxID=8090 RepID=A0A3P9IA14_ORYLA
MEVNPNDSETKTPHKGLFCPQPGNLTRENADSPSVAVAAEDLPSADVGVAPPAEKAGLLSLPLEAMSHIASYLPAHTVIHDLPKVSPFLKVLLEDTTAWQLRAQRLTAHQTCIPVLLKKMMDWPSFCLEMEQLVDTWAEKPLSGEVLMQSVLEGEQGATLRENPEGAENGAGLPEGDLDAKVRRCHLEDLDIANNFLSGENKETMPHQVSKSSSETPALEHIVLPSAHIAQVNSILFLGGEGAICATASRDWSVKLWNVKTGPNGALLYSLASKGETQSHRGWVSCLASIGPLLASGSFDCTVKLWDIEAGGAQTSLIGNAAPIFSLSSQSNVLLAGTFDKKINMYDIRAEATLIKTLRYHKKAVTCIVADDNHIISGSIDSTVVIYDRRAEKILKRIVLKHYPMRMSYDGCVVWAGDCKGLLHAFYMNADQWEKKTQFDVGHHAVITGIHSSPSSLYTCSSDRTFKVHIPSVSPITVRTLKYKSPVSAVCAEAGVVAVATGDASVKVWRPRK